ncbi:MAG: glycosyltransferase family 2 protein [Bacteroidia bacterium]|nr:glycosyltransferase family 2 protein [Bacteroidia bacterium]
MKKLPFASIIIPFYGKCSVLAETLISLMNQTENDFEIVLIDDESPEPANELVQNYRDTLQINYLRIKNKGRAEARNVGSQSAITEILIFLDSDMIVEPNWFFTVKSYILKYPHTVLVGDGDRNKEWAINTFSKYLICIEKSWRKLFDESQPISLDNFKFSACHLVISKELFCKEGGFNNNLSDGEDFELGFRILTKGYKVEYMKDAIVWHNDFPDIKMFAKRLLQYKKSVEKIVAINLVPQKYFLTKKHSLFKRTVSLFLNNKVGHWLILQLINMIENKSYISERSKFKWYSLFLFISK